VIKAVFSASLLQSSVSHDPSEIILICCFDAQETFLIIINVENSWAVLTDLTDPNLADPKLMNGSVPIG